MKNILPFSLIVIAAMILAACGSAASESPASPDFYSISPAVGGGAPVVA